MNKLKMATMRASYAKVIFMSLNRLCKHLLKIKNNFLKVTTNNQKYI